MQSNDQPTRLSNINSTKGGGLCPPPHQPALSCPQHHRAPAAAQGRLVLIYKILHLEHFESPAGPKNGVFFMKSSYIFEKFLYFLWRRDLEAHAV